MSGEAAVVVEPFLGRPRPLGQRGGERLAGLLVGMDEEQASMAAEAPVRGRTSGRCRAPRPRRSGGRRPRARPPRIASGRREFASSTFQRSASSLPSLMMRTPGRISPSWADIGRVDHIARILGAEIEPVRAHAEEHVDGIAVDEHRRHQERIRHMRRVPVGIVEDHADIARPEREAMSRFSISIFSA